MTNTAANPRATIGSNNPPSIDQMLEEKYADLKKRTKAWKKRAEAANLTPTTAEEVAKLDKLVADGNDLVTEAKAAQEKEKEEPAKIVNAINGFFLSKGLIGDIDAAKDPVNKAAAKWKVDQARQRQLEEAKEAERKRKEAEDLIAKADKAEERGEVRQADAYEKRANDAYAEATAAQAAATQDVRVASQMVSGGVRAAANVKMKCASVVVADIDLEAIRMFIKPAALVDAVNAALRINPDLKLKGAVLEEDYSQRVTRK